MCLKRIKKEANDIQDYPSSMFSIIPDAGDDRKWKVALRGPEGSPYEGGIFIVEVIFPRNYPFAEPRYKFITRIYHPNINQNGNLSICLQWAPIITTDKIMAILYRLLEQPNPHAPLRPQVAQLYLKDQDKYIQIAREETQKYASFFFTALI